MSIEHKNLNPENEMKRMFGSKVVMADQHHRHKRGQRHRAPHSRYYESTNLGHILEIKVFAKKYSLKKCHELNYSIVNSNADLRIETSKSAHF